MKCRLCKTELEPTAGAYRCCGLVTRLSDPGYIPSAGYVPSPYRTPETSPFKPLPDDLREDEKGWPQVGPSVYDAAVKRPHPARLPEDDPANIAWRAKLQDAARLSAGDPDAKAARRAGQLRRQAREKAKQDAVKLRYQERYAVRRAS